MLLPLMAGRRSREAFAVSILHPSIASSSGNRNKTIELSFIAGWTTDMGLFTYKGQKTTVLKKFKQLSCASHSLNRNVNRLLSSQNVVLLFTGPSSCRRSVRMRRRRIRSSPDQQGSGRGPRFCFGRGESQLQQHHRKSRDAVY